MKKMEREHKLFPALQDVIYNHTSQNLNVIEKSQYILLLADAEMSVTI